MKRGWGYEWRHENVRTGRNCFGVCIAVRRRDQIWRAAVVTACIVSAAAVVMAILIGGAR
jgi:hypothetical protein